jgi:hypothetical protein
MPTTPRQTLRLAIAGLALAAPLLATAAHGTTPTVTFSGVPLLGLNLSCPSTPSVATLTVPSGSVVDFVNATGRTATLTVGDSRKSLPDESMVPVAFSQGGSVVVRMLPDCPLDLAVHGEMTVTVAADVVKPSPTPVPTVAPHPTATATHTTAPTSPASRSGPASPQPGVALPTFGPVTGLPEPRHVSGLLTLLAVVGVIGVGAAVVRALAVWHRR